MGTCWPGEVNSSTVAFRRRMSVNLRFPLPRRFWLTLKVEMFRSSPYLSDAVNRHIVQSEVEGGVHLGDVAPGTVLEIETENRAYTIEYRGLGQALISGHPVFCPNRPSSPLTAPPGRLHDQERVHRPRHAP